jgi:mono/diheme cytochrome c family protein
MPGILPRAAVAACFVLAAVGASRPALSQTAAPDLNYEFFRDKVEPVFLTKRPGHARCVSCHTVNNAPFHLVPLSPGATAWNEEQSKQNFELVHRVAVAGYMESPLIKHPLAQEAGGDPHHGGGQQFGSQDDPAWQTLKAFVSGAAVN